MKTNRFQHAYRKNASKLHKIVGEILREGLVWGEYEVYQEYPVNKVNPAYPNGSHKFDWVVPKIKLVIECHGKQHYECQTFGAEVEDAISSFHDQQRRDKDKKEAALEAEWIYIEVPYTMEKSIDEIELMNMFYAAKQEQEEYEDIREDNIKYSQTPIKKNRYAQDKAARQRYLSSDLHKEKLAKAKEYRRRQYRRLKELKNES